MYAFGPFRLDVDGQRLWRGEDVVPLQAKAFELLRYLVERPDQLILRDALQQALWPDVVVTDQSLRQAVRRVREALGDDEAAPTYVETVPRRGYRFRAPVHEGEPEPEAPAGADDLARLDALFRRPGVRVVTLNGPAGAGKTRLAHLHAERQPGPVRFVHVAGTGGAATSPPAGPGAAPPPASLVPADLAEGLLVLDGADGAVEALEPAVAALLTHAPAVRVLLTCRDDALGLPGEEVLDLDLGLWRPSPGGRVPGTPFLLDRRLGEGTVGEAWLAHHEALREPRVFKFTFDRERVRSLRREVALFRVLAERVGAHPHIVRLHDVRLDAPPWWLVTDYAEGADLVAWFEARRPPLDARLEVVAQVAEALQAAHDAGVIHRDVKPSNILVSEVNGRVHARLADFGVGQVLDRALLGALTQQGLPPTMVAGTGTAATGTRLYLAPEVVAGEAATPRADLFSLGVVLWQLVVGDLRRALPPDWAEAVSDPLLREDLAAVLAGQPARRLAGPLELARRLRSLPERRAAAEAAEAARKARETAAYRAGVRRTGLLAGAVILLVAALGGAAAWQARIAANARVEAEARALESRRRAARLAVEAGMDRLGEGDPASALLSFVAALQQVEGDPAAERVARIRLAAAYAEAPKPIHAERVAGNGGVAVSPDGRRVAWAEREVGVRVLDTRDGSQRLLEPDPAAGGAELAWHPTRPWLGLRRSAALEGDGTVVILDVEAERVLARAPGAFAGEAATSQVAWDGDTLLLRELDNRRTCELRLRPGEPAPTAPRCEPGGPDPASGPDVLGESEAWSWEWRPSPLGVGRSTLRLRDRSLQPVPGRLSDLVGGGTVDRVAKGAGVLRFDPRLAAYSVLRVPDGAPLSSPAPQENLCWASVDDRLSVLALRCGGQRSILSDLRGPDAATLLQVWRLPEPVPSVLRQPSGAVVARSTRDGLALVLGRSALGAADLETGRVLPLGELGRWSAHSASPDLDRLLAVDGLSLTPEGLGARWALFAPREGRRVATGEQVGGLLARAWRGDGAAFALATGSRVEVRDRDGALLRSMAAPDARGLAWLPDGRLVSLSPARMQVWGEDGAELGAVEVRSAGLVELPGRGAVLTSGGDETTIWDFDPGKPPRARLRLPARFVAAAALDPAGAHLATFSLDGALRTWDAGTGAPLGPAVALAASPSAPAVGFSPDGALLHAWYVDSAEPEDGGQLLTWDVVSGEPLGWRRGPGVYLPRRGPDGSFDLPGQDRPDPRPLEDWVTLAELLSARHLADGTRLDAAESVSRWEGMAAKYPGELR